MPLILKIFNNYSTAQIENLIQVIAFTKITVSMAWFIVVGINLTMGIAWHRFLAFFNIYFKKYPGKQNALGSLPPMISHGHEINLDKLIPEDYFKLTKTQKKDLCIELLDSGAGGGT